MPRSALLHLARRAGIFLGALFAVSVLLAAMPGHHPPVAAGSAAPTGQTSAPASPQTANSSNVQGMLKMDMADERVAEGGAVRQMSGDSMIANAHVTMTAMRPQMPADIAKADEVVAELRAGIDKYKDYRVALADGYKIFMPNLPQQEYHFTNYWNGFLEAFSFDAARPTSLLYRKTPGGYELIGAMYTMPRRATEDELNARVPLSVAVWHLHTNLCMPPRDQLSSADWTKFGLRGSIATEADCDAAGGRFHPVAFGWMVHVYPYEHSLDKIFPMHHRMN